MFTLPAIGAVLPAIGSFLGTTLGRYALIGAAIAGAYLWGFHMGEVHEARVSGAAYAKVQIDLKDQEIAQLKAEAAHNAAVAASAQTERENIDEKYRLLARSLGRAGTCDPFDDAELRELNKVLGWPQAGDRPAAGGAGEGTAAPPALGAREWIQTCARTVEGLRNQLNGWRSWSAKHPAIRGAKR